MASQQVPHEVYQSTSTSAGLTFSGGELKVKEIVSSSGYGVRALKASRVGFAYCQREIDLGPTIARAVAASRFSAKSKFSFVPENNRAARILATKMRTKIFDKRLGSYVSDPSRLSGLLTAAKDAAQAFGGKSRVLLSAETSNVSIENFGDPGGFFGEYGRTSFSIYAETMQDDGFGFAYLSSNQLPSLSSVSGIGERAAQMAKEMRGARKPEPGLYTIVLQQEALENLLDVLLPSFSGDWKRRQVSKLKLGDKMFSHQLTLCEDGLCEDLLDLRAGGASATTLASASAFATASRPFDDEGVLSKRHFLIHDGVVQSFMYDRETAALSGFSVKNTREGSTCGTCGACTRADFSVQPTIGHSNLIISQGKCRDLGFGFPGLGRHIEIHSMHGSHTANQTTGDFGLEVPVAFLVGADGNRTPVRGFMLSGNVFDLFSNIEAIGNKQRTLGSLIAPRIAFGNVRVVC